MRLSRNRNWGHPDLIAYLEWLSQEAAQKDGWPGLLVGDLSQPRGGPMLTGHASHQIGLDADIWLTPMPNRRLSEREREEISAVPVVEPGPHVADPRVWTDGHFRLIRRAASNPRVDRIFVAPGIKKKLCETERGPRGWLGKVRPYWGHNYHFHVRLSCPAGAQGCRNQDPPPKSDGCGEELAYWYSDAPYRPAPKPAKPPKPVTLAGLPNACRAVIASADRPGTRTARDAYLGTPLPSPAAEAAAIMGTPAPEASTAPVPRTRPR
jgi:penicillin-insensitive murein endopeptidase